MTVTTSDEIGGEETVADGAEEGADGGESGGGWHPQLAHLPQLPHPLRRIQVSEPSHVAFQLEVAATDKWCHTQAPYTH